MDSDGAGGSTLSQTMDPEPGMVPRVMASLPTQGAGNAARDI